jgi:4-amino-4-deoxy-L-arabinose transferase-like glycosyltransferase
MSAVPTASLTADLRRNPGLALLLLAGVLLSFFTGLGAVPLFDLDEGAFAEATREMLERGDYISTFLNGEPRYDKPVLVYWLQAVSVLAFGVSEFAFRLPSALCATGWVLMVLLFVRRVAGARPALLAAGFTATAAGITVIGRAAIADALLNFLIVTAMASAYLYLREGRRAWLLCAYVAMGFGLLAKGPVAVLVPLATTFLHCLSRRDLKTWLRAVLDPAGIALMLAIAAPWYAAQYWKEGDAFVRGFLFKHNVDRFRAPMHGFDGSLFFYVPWLLVATLPFLAPLLNAGRGLRRIWADDLQRYCLLWFGFVFLFFSASGTKLPHYVFYGYTGLFILMALQAPRLRSGVLALLPALAVLALLGAAPWLVETFSPRLADPYYREALASVRQGLGAGFGIFTAAACAGVIALMALRRVPLDTRLMAAGVAQAAAMALFVLPAAGEAQQAPVKEAALLARSRGWEVVMWGLNTPSFMVYSGRLVQRRDPRPGEIALVRMKKLREQPGGEAGFELLYQRNGIALVRVPGAAR